MPGIVCNTDAVSITMHTPKQWIIAQHVILYCPLGGPSGDPDLWIWAVSVLGVSDNWRMNSHREDATT